MSGQESTLIYHIIFVLLQLSLLKKNLVLLFILFKITEKTIDEHLDGVKHKQKLEDIKGKSSSNRNQELFSKTLFVYNAQKLHNPNEELIQYFGKYSNTVEVEKVQVCFTYFL